MKQIPILEYYFVNSDPLNNNLDLTHKIYLIHEEASVIMSACELVFSPPTLWHYSGVDEVIRWMRL